MLQKLNSILSGEPADFSFEHRVFNTANFISFFFSSLAIFNNLFLGSGKLLVLTTIIFCGINGIFYYFSRHKGVFKPLIIPYILVMLTFVSINWFLNSGSYGPIIYFLVLASAFFAVISKGIERFFIILGTILLLTILFFFELKFPELINSDYHSDLARLFDSYFWGAGTVLMLFLSLTIIMNNYDYDRNLIMMHKEVIALQRDDLEKNLNYLKRLESALQQDLNEYKQKALQQQMNPHFIFNTLNSLQYFILIKDRKSASDYLVKYANLMRFVLKNSQNQVVKFYDELEATQLYIDLEVLRFENKFDYFINIDDSFEVFEHYLPPLIMQPFVEKAIISSLQPKGEKGKVDIFIKQDDEYLLIEIKDNGVGPNIFPLDSYEPPTKPYGTGIAKQRVELLNSVYSVNFKIDEQEFWDNDLKKTGNAIFLRIPNLSNLLK